MRKQAVRELGDSKNKYEVVEQFDEGDLRVRMVLAFAQQIGARSNLHQRSSHFGVRFSTKARMPSSASRASMFSTMISAV